MPSIPYASSKGVRIYYEVEGSGSPLVLHIGFLGSLEDWRRDDTRFVQALRDAYRLVLLDPRGQGRSDAPHDPSAYTLDQRVGDVLAVLDAEGIERAHYWGYSMGGWVDFGLGVSAHDRIVSLVLGGADPFQSDAGPIEDDAWPRLFREGMPAFVADWERRDPNMPATMRERWLALDARAMAAAQEAGLTAPSLEDMLPAIITPTPIYYGTDDYPDRLPERAAAKMPNATVVALEGLNHAQAMRRSDLVLPHVVAFLGQVTRVPAAVVRLRRANLSGNIASLWPRTRGLREMSRPLGHQIAVRDRAKRIPARGLSRRASSIRLLINGIVPIPNPTWEATNDVHRCSATVRS
jgi:pimeloyl-ACP methyl ester carboxylesterase